MMKVSTEPIIGEKKGQGEAGRPGTHPGKSWISMVAKEVGRSETLHVY